MILDLCNFESRCHRVWDVHSFIEIYGFGARYNYYDKNSRNWWFYSFHQHLYYYWSTEVSSSSFGPETRDSEISPLFFLTQRSVLRNAFLCKLMRYFIQLYLQNICWIFTTTITPISRTPPELSFVLLIPTREFLELYPLLSRFISPFSLTSLRSSVHHTLVIHLNLNKIIHPSVFQPSPTIAS